MVLVLKCVLAASHPLESHWSRRGLGNTFLIHCQEGSQDASLKFLYVQVSISAAYMAFFFFFNTRNCFLENVSWASEMAQQVKALRQARQSAFSP